MMKAIRMHAYGGPEVLQYEDAPRPEAGPGEVLIRVHAAGLNPADWKRRSRPPRTGAMPAFPVIPGWDVSGVVDGLGPGVTDYQIGDAVYGMLRFPDPGAAYAEYATAPAEHMALKPLTLDHVHAAAVPLAGLTAWQGLFVKAGLVPGQSVLVLGASGGVGHLAVQFARSQSAEVYGTASTRNLDFLRELGVDHPIDYTTTPIEAAVREAGVVFDTVGGETRDRSLAVLKPGGILVSIVSPAPDADAAAAAGVRATGMYVSPSGDQLRQIAELIDAGQVRIVLDTVLPLAEARRAHELSEGGHVRGKIVLQVKA
jgi:NADPH:quinone reductase-like Zn-dependent oxidoreductase